MAKAQAAKIPSLVYGTAWKKEATRPLVKQALQAGFRGVDTAAQPRHYREDLVGQGIRDAISDGTAKREDLWIQTKYTPIHGQDPLNTPYDASKSITAQVSDSITRSLPNLRHTESSSDPYIDCLILHSPFPSPAQTQEAYRAMELHVPHLVRTLGLSNVYSPSLLRELHDFASVKPIVLQNRFHPATGYDSDIRAVCEEREMTYQSFWTLTANPDLLRSSVVEAVAEKAGASRAVGLYALVLGLGKVSVLNGTTSAERMGEDVEGLRRVEAWAEREPQAWKEVQEGFRQLLR